MSDAGYAAAKAALTNIARVFRGGRHLRIPSHQSAPGFYRDKPPRADRAAVPRKRDRRVRRTVKVDEFVGWNSAGSPRSTAKSAEWSRSLFPKVLRPSPGGSSSLTGGMSHDLKDSKRSSEKVVQGMKMNTIIRQQRLRSSAAALGAMTLVKHGVGACEG